MILIRGMTVTSGSTDLKTTLYRFAGRTVPLCIITTVMLLLGQLLGIFFIYLPADSIAGTLTADSSNILLFHAAYLMNIFIWFVFLPVILFIPKNRFILKYLTVSSGSKARSGILLACSCGFFSCLICVIAALIHKEIQLNFTHGSPLFLLTLFVCVFLQSSAEEIAIRGFLFLKLLKRSKDPVLAMLISSLLFAALHIFNDSITPLGFINLFLLGMAVSLIFYQTGNLWAAFAFHTLWNYSQSVLFGLPNSGNASAYSLFTASVLRSGPFFNADFGLEGSLFLTALLPILIAGLICLKKKRGRSHHTM